MAAVGDVAVVVAVPNLAPEMSVKNQVEAVAAEEEVVVVAAGVAGAEVVAAAALATPTREVVVADSLIIVLGKSFKISGLNNGLGSLIPLSSGNVLHAQLF